MARPRRIDQLHGASEDSCAERIVHMDAVRSARTAMPDPGVVDRATALYAVLADPTRLRIVAALKGGELCVCDLSAVVGQSESAVSHQLRVLREHGLVRSRKDGRRRYYVLDDQHVEDLFGVALAHVSHTDQRGGSR